MRTAALSLFALTLLAGCAASYPPEQRSMKAEDQLRANLAGRIAGPPQNCISTFRSNDMTVIDNQTLLFRDGATVWLNNTAGGCAPLADGGYTLVTENFGSALCRGTIARVVSQDSNRVVMGNCVMGDFIPYRRP